MLSAQSWCATLASAEEFPGCADRAQRSELCLVAELQAGKQHPQLHAIFPGVRKVVLYSFLSCLLLQGLLLPSASNY